MSYRYSVLTYIFDGYENVREREGQNEQDDVDYVLVTDDPNLKSSSWRVVVDDDLFGLRTFEKCYRVRYNLFKYAKTETCIYVDGSMQLKGSLDSLVEDFAASKAEMALIPHPLIPTFDSELRIWIEQRNYPIERANNFLQLLKKSCYDLSYRGQFIAGVQVRKNNKCNEDFENLVLSFLRYLSDEKTFERNDQLVMTYVLNTFFNQIQVFPLAYNAIMNSAIRICDHNSTKEREIPFQLVDPNVEHCAYMFNQVVKCYNMK